MWLLPTRGRKELCQEALDACFETRMTSAGVIFVDDRIDDYADLVLPNNWLKAVGPLTMAETMRWAFNTFPHEVFYGWIADDLRPRTTHWDKKLEDAAGGWFISHCSDGYLEGAHLSGAFCWGGELVRNVGWWALPEVKQAGIDNAWFEVIGRTLQNVIYRDDVVVEHLHWKNSKRPRDETDNWSRDGYEYIRADFEIFKQWRASGKPREICDELAPIIELAKKERDS